MAAQSLHCISMHSFQYTLPENTTFELLESRVRRRASADIRDTKLRLINQSGVFPEGRSNDVDGELLNISFFSKFLGFISNVNAWNVR